MGRIEIDARRLKLLLGCSLVAVVYFSYVLLYTSVKTKKPRHRSLADKLYAGVTEVVRALTLLIVCWGCSVIFKKFEYIATLFKRSVAIGNGKDSFLYFISGQPVSLVNSEIKWGWKGRQEVGSTFNFDIEFLRINGRPFPVKAYADKIEIRISKGSIAPEPVVEFAEDSPHIARVSFTIHKSGQYSVSVKFDGFHVRGSLALYDFQPGPADPQNTTLLHQTNTVVKRICETHNVYIDMRDNYNNKCLATDIDLSDFCCEIKEIVTGTELPVQPGIEFQEQSRNVQISFEVPVYGVYSVGLTYKQDHIIFKKQTVLALRDIDYEKALRYVTSRKGDACFEAILLSCDKPKKVSCFVSSKQLVIKDYFMKIFPRRIRTFRINPYTEFSFYGRHNKFNCDMISVKDANQNPVFIATKDTCLLIVATFALHVERNIGGSETFSEKKEHFFQSLREFHKKKSRSQTTLMIDRSKLLESSLRATKHLTTHDWLRNFEIKFMAEEGLDYGGIRREWFTLLSGELFETSGLFSRLNPDDAQSLMHPSSSHGGQLNKKHFELAGRLVGKCVFESAQGRSYQQYIRAKFSRSFLAQVLGLRVNYRYLEQDDPLLYKTKIKYIEENSVEDMDLTFSEEIYVNGKLVDVIDLIPNGRNTKVTNSNKMKYLDSLAQYRLVTTVKPEVQAFTQALSEIVPDHLLCVFDENELELLFCGSDEYSVEDLKKNHVIESGGSYNFNTVTMPRFWSIISSFTNDDMARLVQFITGCSQLPANGFSDLVPFITFSSAPGCNRLPVAHTCFNQLCLPEYDSMEFMHQSLLTAINDGNQGFLLI